MINLTEMQKGRVFFKALPFFGCFGPERRNLARPMKIVAKAGGFVKMSFRFILALFLVEEKGGS